VPFFDSRHALKIILQDLQLDSIYDMFAAFSPQPVAAASLGQVLRLY
jgi:predicted unusual protein kinase regulating ubiquinone biosynthesis (AarF/ABC1/UbiB family)